MDTRHSRRVGNTLPHHSGSQHTDLFGDLGWHILGSRRTAIDLVHLEEEGVDHVFRLRRQCELGKAPAFNPHSGLEINCECLHRHIKDLFGSRQEATRVLADHRCTHGHHLRNLWVSDVAAGNLVTLGIPGLGSRRLVVFVCHHPFFGSANKAVFVIDDRVDQSGC